MVREVKRVLQRGPCTLSQLAAELGASREIVRSALHFWLTRGDVDVETGRREAMPASMGASGASCDSCASGISGRSGIGPAVYNWR